MRLTLYGLAMCDQGLGEPGAPKENVMPMAVSGKIAVLVIRAQTSSAIVIGDRLLDSCCLRSGAIIMQCMVVFACYFACALSLFSAVS